MTTSRARAARGSQAALTGAYHGVAEWALPFLIVFIGGYNMGLPVAHESMAIPRWFQPIQVVYGVYLKETLLMLYLGLALVFGALSRFRLERRTNTFAVLIVCLGYIGVISTVVNQTRLLDVGQAFRLFLLAAYFAALTIWNEKLGSTFVLRSFLIGLAVGGAINLYYTFRVSFMTLGILPFLLGQNGPGGYLGLGIGLAAWLTLIRRSRLDAIVAVTVSVVGVFAATISYSRLSMLMALCGLLAWTAVIVSTVSARASRRLGLSLAGIVLAAGVFLSATDRGAEYVASASQFFTRKFNDVTIADTNSVGGRYMYAWAVLEILEENPVFGVGYSGFYDAVTDTNYYQTGLTPEEDPELGRMGRSNPHNAFLYYISANGIPGLVLVTSLFVLFLKALHLALAPYGRVGFFLWVSLATAYFINGMTLPTLYNTEVMYLPAALAFSSARLRPGALIRNPNRPVTARRTSVA